MRLWPAAFLVLSALQAQQVYLPGEDVMAPKVIERSAPDYTDEARLARLQGTVRLKLIVDADGTVRDPYVTSPIGLGLDQKAVEAAKDWKFAPGMKDGKTVPVLISIDANFHLLAGRNDWHLARALFDTPKGASEPVVVEANYPSGDDEAAASARVSFDLNDQGVPANVKVDRISDERRESEIAAIVSGWRFRPAMQGGKPVSVRGVFDFVHGVPVVQTSALK
jgi:TonB family protein